MALLGHNELIWYFLTLPLFNPLKPSGAIWGNNSGSTLTQVMACCLMAPSHYLNPCWFLISSEDLWHSSESNFTSTKDTILYEFENYTLKITVPYPRGQWVNMQSHNHLFVCLSLDATVQLTENTLSTRFIFGADCAVIDCTTNISHTFMERLSFCHI